MNGSAAGCSGRFPSGLAFLRGCSDDSFRSRLAAPPGAGMAVSLRNRVALKILRASGGGFRPWRTDFALQPRPVSSEALWPCSRSLVLFGTESVLLQDRGIRRSVIDVLIGSAASSRTVGHRRFPACLQAAWTSWPETDSRFHASSSSCKSSILRSDPTPWGCGSIWFNAQFTQPGCQSFSALAFGLGLLH